MLSTNLGKLSAGSEAGGNYASDGPLKRTVTAVPLAPKRLHTLDACLCMYALISPLVWRLLGQLVHWSRLKWFKKVFTQTPPPPSSTHLVLAHHPHAAAPAPIRRLKNDWEAVRVGELLRFLQAGDRSIRARDHWHTYTERIQKRTVKMVWLLIHVLPGEYN